MTQSFCFFGSHLTILVNHTTTAGAFRRNLHLQELSCKI
jgi:hypothetical protein